MCSFFLFGTCWFVGQIFIIFYFYLPARLCVIFSCSFLLWGTCTFVGSIFVHFLLATCSFAGNISVFLSLIRPVGRAAGMLVSVITSQRLTFFTSCV